MALTVVATAPLRRLRIQRQGGGREPGSSDSAGREGRRVGARKEGEGNPRQLCKEGEGNSRHCGSQLWKPLKKSKPGCASIHNPNQGRPAHCRAGNWRYCVPWRGSGSVPE